MNSVHLHLALTHVPVVGAVIAFLLLGAAILQRKQEVVRASLWMFVVLSLAAIAVYMTGEGAEHAVESLPGVSEPIMERHEDAALAATIALGAFGVGALLLLLVFRHRIPRGVTIAALMIAVAPVALILWTANLGGQIRHTEIRAASAGAVVPGAEAEAERLSRADAKRKRDDDDR